MPATLDDFLRLPEGTLADFIGGEILTSPSPKTRHQRLVSSFHFDLTEFVRRERFGEVFVAPYDVHLPNGDTVRPGDRLFTLESEKAAEDIETLDSGILRIRSDGPKVGDVVAVGAVIGYLVERFEEELPGEPSFAPLPSQSQPIEEPTPATDRGHATDRRNVTPRARRAG